MFIIVFALRGPDSDHRFWTGAAWSASPKSAATYPTIEAARKVFTDVTRPTTLNAHTFLVSHYGTGTPTILAEIREGQLVDHTARAA